MPKAKGTLYVGYTKYPNLSKTQEGYLRQGKDVEDDFILFKRGLVENPKEDSLEKETKPVPPEVLYLAVNEKHLKNILLSGIKVSKGLIIRLSNSTASALSKSSDKHLLKINTLQMIKDNINFKKNKDGMWCVETIDSKYISLIV